MAIGLRVVHSRGCRFNTDKAPELGGELCDELRAPVGDILTWGTVMAPDVPVVQPGSADCVEPGGTLIEMSTLTKNVNDDHNRIVPVSFRELDNEIDGNSVPLFFRNLGRVQLANR